MVPGPVAITHPRQGSFAFGPQGVEANVGGVGLVGGEEADGRRPQGLAERRHAVARAGADAGQQGDVGSDRRPPQGHAVVEVGGHEQHVGVDGGDLGGQGGEVAAVGVVREVTHQLLAGLPHPRGGALAHGSAVGVVDVGHRVPQGLPGGQLGRQLLADEVDRRPSQVGSHGRQPEEAAASDRRRPHLADGSRLPEAQVLTAGV